MPVARPSSLRALRHPAYRRWTVAGVVSVSGTWMQQVAQAWLVLEVSDSGAAVGLTVAAQSLPTLLFGLWGGGVADRYDRRLVLLVTQSLAALLAVGLALVVAGGSASVAVVQLFAFASGLVAVVDGPASGAFGASLLPRDDLANGLALGGLVSAAGRVFGLAAAGVAVAAIGPTGAFVVNALTFLAPIGVLLSLPGASVAAPSAAPVDRSLAHGVRHVWSVVEVRATLLAAFALGCFGRSFQVTMAAMAATTFAGGPGLYGRFSTVFALGAVAGSLVAARMAAMTRRALVAAACTAAACQLVSGVAPSAPTFALLMVPVAAGAVVLDTAVLTRVQLLTDARLRGRVLAVAGMVGTAAGLVGAPLLGWLGERLGARAPLVLGGAVAIGAALALRAARGREPDPLAPAVAAHVEPVVAVGERHVEPPSSERARVDRVDHVAHVAQPVG